MAEKAQEIKQVFDGITDAASKKNANDFLAIYTKDLPLEKLGRLKAARDHLASKVKAVNEGRNKLNELFDDVMKASEGTALTPAPKTTPEAPSSAEAGVTDKADETATKFPREKKQETPVQADAPKPAQPEPVPAPTAAPVSAPIQAPTPAPAPVPVVVSAPVAPAATPTPAPAATPATGAVAVVAPPAAPEPAPSTITPSNSPAEEYEPPGIGDAVLKTMMGNAKIAESFKKLAELPFVGGFLLSLFFSKKALKAVEINIQDMKLDGLLQGLTQNQKVEIQENVRKVMIKNFKLKETDTAEMFILANEDNSKGQKVSVADFLKNCPNGFNTEKWKDICKQLNDRGAAKTDQRTVMGFMLDYLKKHPSWDLAAGV